MIKIWEQRVHHLVPMELVSDSHTHTTTTETSTTVHQRDGSACGTAVVVWHAAESLQN